MDAGERDDIAAMLDEGIAAVEIARRLIVPINDVRIVEHERRATTHPDLTRARVQPLVPHRTPPRAVTPETPPMTITPDVETPDVFTRAAQIDDQRIAKALERAVQARDALTDLVDRHEAESEARARIAYLEAQLEAERAKLRKPRQPKPETPAPVVGDIPHSIIRAWAIAASVPVPEKGPVPRAVVEQYYAAHPDAASVAS